MTVDRCSEVDEADVNAVVEAFAAGHVVLIPTDTVYGLAADPRSPEAMNRLRGVKRRPDGVPIAMLVASIEQALTIVVANPIFDDLAGRHWPGPLTLVARRRREVDLGAGTTETIGVRVADHPFVRAVTAAVGPIAATSANLHGEPPIVDPIDAIRVFGDDVAVVVDHGLLAGVASTVVDTTGKSPVVLREGVLTIAT